MEKGQTDDRDELRIDLSRLSESELDELELENENDFDQLSFDDEEITGSAPEEAGGAGNENTDSNA